MTQVTKKPLEETEFRRQMSLTRLAYLDDNFITVSSLFVPDLKLDSFVNLKSTGLYLAFVN